MNIINYTKKLLHIFDKSFISIIPLILLFLLSTMIDIIGIALIAPYISFLINPESTVFFTNIFNHLKMSNSNFDDIVIYSSLLLIAIFFLKFIFALGVRFAIARFALKCRFNLQIKLLNSYQFMKYSNFINRGSSEFIKNVRELSGDCITTLDSSLKIASEIIVFTAVILYLFWIEPFVVISLLFLILIIVSIHNFTLKPKTIKYGENKVKALDYIYQAVDEGLKGFKEVKILNKERYFKNILKKGADKVYESELKSSLILYYPRYLYEFIIVIFILSFVLLKINQGNSIADIIPIVGAFAVAGVRVIPSVLHWGLIMIYLFHIDVIFNDLVSIKKDRDTEKINPSHTLDINEINLKNIKFKYKNASNNVFKILILM